MMNDAERMVALAELDASEDVTVTSWEAAFIESMMRQHDKLNRTASYRDKHGKKHTRRVVLFMSGKQRKVVDGILNKYE